MSSKGGTCRLAVLVTDNKKGTWIGKRYGKT